jgi:hypothetical protein
MRVDAVGLPSAIAEVLVLFQPFPSSHAWVGYIVYTAYISLHRLTVCMCMVLDEMNMQGVEL